MLTSLKRCLNTYYLPILFGMAYCVGTLSTQHYNPGNYDAIPNFAAFIIASLACMPFLWRLPHIKMPLIAWGMLYFFVLLLIQPFITPEKYIDTMLFPAGIFLSGLLVALAVYNVQNKPAFLSVLSWFILFAAVGNSFALLAQNFHWTFFSRWLVFDSPISSRPTGNVAQPNQAAFIIALGMAVIGFHFLRWRSQHRLGATLLALMLFFLAIGMGLTASRTGVIYLVFLFAALFIYALRNDRKISLPIALLLLIVILGYALGTYFLAHGYFQQESGIARIAGTHGAGTRKYLQEQALMLFSQHPLTGAGFGNFIESSLQHAQQLTYLTYVNNSHFIFTQIAAELGILGLLGVVIFVYVIVRNIRIKTTSSHYLLLLLLGIIVLYSLSEYPLWYYRFLLLFIILLALLPQAETPINPRFGKVFSMLSGLLFVLGIFYLHTFNQYVNAYYKISATTDPSDRLATIRKTPDVFGTSAYRDLLLFMAQPISEDKIAAKIRLGYSVLSRFPSPQMMLRQGVLLALADKSNDAAFLFDALCKFRYGSQCAATIAQLKVLAQDEPTHFATLYQQLAAKYPDYVEK